MNSLYCFLTALVPLMLNIRTKYWFYKKSNDLVKFFFRKDKEAMNHVQVPKTKRYAQPSESLEEAPSDIILSKEESDQQESSAYITVLFLSLFFSLVINYIYSIFL